MCVYKYSPVIIQLQLLMHEVSNKLRFIQHLLPLILISIGVALVTKLVVILNLYIIPLDYQAHF